MLMNLGASVSDGWYYADGNGQVGPLTLQELKEALATPPNSNAEDILVWCDGFSSWKPAKDVVELRRPVPPPLPSRDIPKQVKPGSSDIPGVTYWVQDDGSVIAQMDGGERCQFKSWSKFWEATQQQRANNNVRSTPLAAVAGTPSSRSLNSGQKALIGIIGLVIVVYVFVAGGGESRPRKSGQDDRWSFCLTAGTLCPTNQETR
jgi:hypothetical protein